MDEFRGDLAGLILAEAGFEAPDMMAAFPTPDFAVREVTDDPRFTGDQVVANGLPAGDGARVAAGVKSQ